jgi:hypothetical protein
MTWTPRRKSNRLRNSKLNPIDLDANPEAAEPLDDLEIVNFDTPVKVTESHSQHNTSPSVSSHSVRRQLITESTTPIKRARLDKTVKHPKHHLGSEPVQLKKIMNLMKLWTVLRVSSTQQKKLYYMTEITFRRTEIAVLMTSTDLQKKTIV